MKSDTFDFKGDYKQNGGSYGYVCGTSLKGIYSVIRGENYNDLQQKLSKL